MTDLIPTAEIDISIDAFNALWDMLQDESGQPFNVQANDAMIAIYDNLKAMVHHNQQIVAANDALRAMLEDLRIQRNQLARDAENVRSRASKITRKEIAHLLNYEMLSDYSHVIAEDLLSVLTGDDIGLSSFTISTLKEALEAAASEIADLYDGGIDAEMENDHD